MKKQTHYQKIVESRPKIDKRNKPLYAMFYVDNNGKYYGMSEHSFSMNLSDHRVRVFNDENRNRNKTSKKEKYPFNAKTDEGKDVVIIDSFYVRLSRKNCPFKVDFQERRNMNNKIMKFDKYKWRNIPFVHKD